MSHVAIDRPRSAHAPARALPVALALLVALAAPRAASAQGAIGDRCAQSSRKSSSISDMSNSDSDDGHDRRRVVVWKSGACEFTMRSTGEVTVTPALDDITKLSPGGWVELEERTGDVVRRLEIRNRNGTLERRWSLDGDADRFDVDRQAWLRDMLLTLERRTGIFAATRVPQLFREGGADAVLRAADSLEGDYARKLYLTALIGQSGLDERSTLHLLDLADQRMTSDYERAEVLRALAKAQPSMSDAIAAGYVKTAGHMTSDYEKRRALTAAIDAVGSGRARPALYEAAASITSDYERAELLIAALKTAQLDPTGREAFFRAVHRFSSDYERRRALSALLAEHPKDAEVLKDLLTATGEMSSDYERAELLLAFARAVPLEGTVREQYMAAAKRITSDHEYRRVLQALVAGERAS